MGNDLTRAGQRAVFGVLREEVSVWATRALSSVRAGSWGRDRGEARVVCWPVGKWSGMRSGAAGKSEEGGREKRRKGWLRSQVDKR